jgi:hypothetical protein
MEKEKEIASKIITFVTYHVVPKKFEQFISNKSILLQIPRDVINIFSKRNDLNGVIFSGDPNRDRLAWSLISQGNNFYSFFKEIAIIRKPFFIFAPKNIVSLLNQEFIRNGVFVSEYGRKLHPVLSFGFCEVSNTGSSISIFEVEPVCKN